MSDGESYADYRERRVNQVAGWVPLEKEEIEERVDEMVSKMEDHRDDVDEEKRKAMASSEMIQILGEYDELPSQDELGMVQAERQAEK